MRDALAIGAAVSIIRNCGRTSAHIERATEHRERRSAGISVERKHLLIERHRLRRRDRSTRDGISAAQRKLLQNVILKCRSRNGGGRDDGQRDPNPLAIEEEKQLVVNDRAAQAAAEMVHGRARLVISRGGIREIVGRVEPRAVPQLIEISVKLVRTRFRDVVDLRRSVPPLVDRIGKRVDRHFRDRIQSENEVCREPAVQIRQRIVCFQPIDDVAVRESGQSVELHVAVPISSPPTKSLPLPAVLHQRARGKLKRISQITAWIRKVFQRRRIESRRCICIFRVDEGSSPLTSMVCLDCAILSVKLTVCFCPRPGNAVSFCWDAKPSASL